MEKKSRMISLREPINVSFLEPLLLYSQLTAITSNVLTKNSIIVMPFGSGMNVPKESFCSRSPKD